MCNTLLCIPLVGGSDIALQAKKDSFIVGFIANDLPTSNVIWVVSVPDILQCMDEKLITEGSRWWGITQQQGRICKLMLWKTYILSLVADFLQIFHLQWLFGLLARQRSWLCSVLNLRGLISLCPWDAKRFLELHLLLPVLLCGVLTRVNWSRQVFPMLLVLPLLPLISTKEVVTSSSQDNGEEKIRGATETHRQYLNRRTSGQGFQQSRRADVEMKFE